MGIKAEEIAFLLPLLLGGVSGVAGLFNRPTQLPGETSPDAAAATGGMEPKPDQGPVMGKNLPAMAQAGAPMPNFNAPAVAATVGGRHVLPPMDIYGPGGQRPQVTAEGPPMLATPAGISWQPPYSGQRPQVTAEGPPMPPAFFRPPAYIGQRPRFEPAGPPAPTTDINVLLAAEALARQLGIKPAGLMGPQRPMTGKPMGLI